MRSKKVKGILGFLLLLWTGWSIGSIIFDPKHHYFDRYYTEATYKQLEQLYNTSQYRLKNPTSLIGDEVVFRYASGAYVRGVNPILINSEITPLGKYIVGLSYLWFQNDGVVMTLFACLSLFALWLLGKETLGDRIYALIPVALFSAEPLFQNQLRVTPLMDIIQLPFILFSLLFFLREWKRGNFFWTCLMLGLVAATKSIIPAALLILTFVIFFVTIKQFQKVLRFIPWLTVSLVVFTASYTRTFWDGYTVLDFLGFQKWILLYQQSKLLFPLSFWPLVFFNRWQTWWGDMAVQKAVDWRLSWPILVTVPFVVLALFVRKNLRISKPTVLLLLCAFAYMIFLSLGVVVTRFLLPLLPILYILAMSLVQSVVKKGRL